MTGKLSGGIWVCRPVSEEPESLLRDWHVFEVQLPCWASRTRHFAGTVGRWGEGRVSSRVITFDTTTVRGITDSGRVYELRRPQGFTLDAQYTFARWLRINAAMDVVDVSREIYVPSTKT